MSLEAAIMGFLAEEPRSGYDLKTRCFDAQVRPFWTADQAQIYRTLERLQSARMVSCSRKRQVGRPDRKIYRLTQTGEAALAEWLGSETLLEPLRDPFLLQVYFSTALSDSEILVNLEQRRDQHQTRLDELRRQVAPAFASPARGERTRLLRDAALDGAIARERAAIDWLDDTIEAIREGRLPAHRKDSSADSDLHGTGSA